MTLQPPFSSFPVRVPVQFCGWTLHILCHLIISCHDPKTPLQPSAWSPECNRVHFYDLLWKCSFSTNSYCLLPYSGGAWIPPKSAPIGYGNILISAPCQSYFKWWRRCRKLHSGIMSNRRLAFVRSLNQISVSTHQWMIRRGKVSSQCLGIPAWAKTSIRVS